MKKLVCIAALMLVALGSYAQENESPFDNLQIGVTGGVGATLYKDIFHDIRFGVPVFIGANATLPINGVPGLYVLGEGKLALRTTGTGYTGRMTNLYLMIPIRAGYNIPVDDTMQVYIEAGPYVALGIKISHEVDTHGYYNPFDLGICAHAGVELNKRYKVGLAFDRGFISPFRTEHLANHGVWVTFTYLF